MSSNTKKEHRNPALTVDAIIKYGSGVIMIKRGHDPYKNCWALPGGFVEYGETVEEAVRREIKEETDLEIEIKDIIGVYSDPKRDPRGHVVSICFLVDGKGNLKAGSDASDAHIKSIGNFPDKMAFDHDKMLRDAFDAEA